MMRDHYEGTPLYCCSKRAPECYNDPKASDVDFSWDSAFWVCNWVSNMVFPRYSIMYPELSALRDSLQGGYEKMAEGIENEVISLLEDNADAAIEKVTGDRYLEK